MIMMLQVGLRYVHLTKPNEELGANLCIYIYSCTCPKGSMGVVVKLKSKMAPSSGSSGGIVWDHFYLSYLKAQTNRPSHYSMAQPHQNTRQHYCHLNFLLWGNTITILDSTVTTTPTMHIPAAKVLRDIIIHKVCCP